MPRKKTTSTLEKGKKNKSDKPEDVAEFAQDYTNTMLNMMGGNLAYHPLLQNQTLKDINMNPVYRNYEAVEALINDPKNHEKELRQLSQYFYNAVMPIKRLVDYYSKVLTWDYLLIPQVDGKDMNSTAYKKSENKAYDFLEKLSIKKMFTEMMTGAVLEDTKFYYLRDSENGYAFQELPSDYCLITSKNEVSYEYSFDMTYFFKPGTMLDQYPPEFTQYYIEMMGYDRTKGDMKTKDVIVENKGGKWFYWRQLDPNKSFTFKFNNNVAGLTPPLMGLFLDAVNIEQFRKLHKTKITLDAYKLLIGTVPRNKESKGAKRADDFAIKASTVAKFATLVKNSLPDGVDFKVTPFDNIESFKFDNQDNQSNITGEALKSFFNNSGSSQTLTINDKPNASSVTAGQKIDAAFVSHLYLQGEAILKLLLNKHICSKYKFDIQFIGTIFDKKERQEDADKLASIGVVSMDLIASARGLNARQLERLIDKSNARGYPEKLIPIQSAFQSSGDESTNGRPKKAIEDLGDAGELDRDRNDTE